MIWNYKNILNKHILCQLRIFVNFFHKKKSRLWLFHAWAEFVAFTSFPQNAHPHGVFFMLIKRTLPHTMLKYYRIRPKVYGSVLLFWIFFFLQYFRFQKYLLPNLVFLYNMNFQIVKIYSLDKIITVKACFIHLFKFFYIFIPRPDCQTPFLFCFSLLTGRLS